MSEEDAYCDSYGSYGECSFDEYDGYGGGEELKLEKKTTAELFQQNRNFAYHLIDNKILKSTLSDKITTIEKQLLEQDIKIDIGNIWQILRNYKFKEREAQTYVDDNLDYLLENKLMKEENKDQKNNQCILCYGEFESHK